MCKPSPLWLLLDGGVDPTALEGLNCQQELWNSIRWNFVSDLNKKNGSQFFLEEKMKQVAALDLLEVVWSKNRKKTRFLPNGDEKSSIFSEKAGSYLIIMAL